MKKFYIIVSVWVILLMGMVRITAKSEIDFLIRYDTHTKQTYEVKQHIQEIYRELVSGIHKESYVLMVMNNMEEFAYKEDIEVTWNDNKLIVQEGDGQGTQLNGSLSANSICVPDVQPRSLLGELFG